MFTMLVFYPVAITLIGSDVTISRRGDKLAAVK